MAQEQQNSIKSVYIPGQGWVPIELAGQAQAQPPSLGINLPPMEEPTTPDEIDRAQAFKEMGGSLLELGAGLLPVGRGLGLAGRIAAPTILDAITGAVRGKLTGEGAINEAVDNATLGAVGNIGGEVLPFAGYTMGQVLGGKIGRNLEDAGAFLRERKRQWEEGKLGIPIGARRRLSSAMEETGAKLAAAEGANTARVPLKETIMGAQPGLMEKTYTAADPMAMDKTIKSELRTTATSHAKKRGQWVRTDRRVPGKAPTGPGATGAPPTAPTAQILDAEVYEPVIERGLRPYEPGTAISTAVKRPLPSRRRILDAEPVGELTPLERGALGAPLGLGEPVTDIPSGVPQGARDRIRRHFRFEPAQDVSMREAGDLKRAFSSRGSAYIDARRNKDMMIPEEKGMVQTAIGDQFRKAQELNDVLPSGEPGPISQVNSRLSDLFTMEGANERIRDAGLFARVLAMGGRAGLGYGLGMASHNVLGTDPGLSSVLGIASMFGASPRGVSSLGNASGVLANAAPTAYRGLELYNLAELQKRREEEEEKRVRLREPK